MKKGVRDRQDAARPRHPPLRRRADRLGGEPRRLGEGSAGNTKRIAETFREACAIAEDHGERLAAEGEICWGGMHSWKRMLELLEMVGPAAAPSAFRPTWRTRCCSRIGCNAPEDRLLPEGYDWSDRDTLDRALEDDDERAAPVDDRFPRRAERRHRQGIGIARQDRPPLPAERSQRQDGHRPRRRRVAARRCGQTDARRSSTSAGTAACFRTPR